MKKYFALQSLQYPNNFLTHSSLSAGAVFGGIDEALRFNSTVELIGYVKKYVGSATEPVEIVILEEQKKFVVKPLDTL